MGKNTVEAKQWLDKHYTDSAPMQSTTIDWYAEFKRDPKKILLPLLHVKLGIVKDFVKAMDKNEEGFRFLKRKLP